MLQPKAKVKSNKESRALAKRFGTAETIAYIFERPSLMQKLVELSDQTGDMSRQMGFSQTKYEMLLNEFLATKGVDDAARYKAVYSLENLKQANILIDWDIGKKRLTFCDSFIELIRLSDERLIKELTDVEYKGMLEEMKRLRDKLAESGLNGVDQEAYYDIRFAMFDHLRRIKTAIRSNEVKFKLISKKLADLSTGITEDDIVYAKAKREMYSSASKIYERHIKPTVEFLDESLQVDGGNLFTVLREIIEIFSQRLEHSHVEELTFSMLNLSNSYKPIDEIASEVRKFLSISRNNARAFNAFEQVNAHLDEALKGIRDRSLRNKNLANNVELLHVFDFFTGTEGSGAIKAQSGLLFADNQAFFDSMSLDVKQLLAAKGVVEELELSAVEVIENAKKIKKDIKDKERASKLVKLVNGLELRETEDLYGLLNDRMSTLLPNYSFFDLHVITRGIRGRIEKTNFEVIPTGFQKTIDLNDNKYKYTIRKLKKVSQ